MALPLATVVNSVLWSVSRACLSLLITDEQRPRETVKLKRVDHPISFTSTEVVYGVTGTDVTVLPEYGVSP